jgi:hypothetical protein
MMQIPNRSEVRKLSDEQLQQLVTRCEEVIRRQKANFEDYETCRSARLELQRRELWRRVAEPPAEAFPTAGV